MAVEGARNLRGKEADEFVEDFFLEETIPNGKPIDYKRWCTQFSGYGGGCCTRPRGHGGIHVNIPQAAGHRQGDVIHTWFGER